MLTNFEVGVISVCVCVCACRGRAKGGGGKGWYGVGVYGGIPPPFKTRGSAPAFTRDGLATLSPERASPPQRRFEGSERVKRPREGQVEWLALE